jgi:hypothetical protein
VLGVQLYVKPPAPPVDVTVNVVLLPLHIVMLPENELLIEGGDVNVKTLEVVQPALSLTFKVYVFQNNEVILDVVAPVFQE